MRKGVHKKETGVSLDIDVYEVFVANPEINRSAWMNNVIRAAMIEKGMLKVDA